MDDGFIIMCHNTTLSDGTKLDNNQPAPEFVIATLEKRTGVSRPPDAERCSLSDVNLYFTSGGIIVPKPMAPAPPEAPAS